MESLTPAVLPDTVMRGVQSMIQVVSK